MKPCMCVTTEPKDARASTRRIRTRKTDLRRKGEFAIISQFREALRNSSLLPRGTSCPETVQEEKDAQSSWPPAWSFVPWSTLPFLPVGLSSNTRENGVVEGFPKHSLSKVGVSEACFSFGFAVKEPRETAFLNSRQPVLLKNFDLELFLKKTFFEYMLVYYESWEKYYLALQKSREKGALFSFGLRKFSDLGDWSVSPEKVELSQSPLLGVKEGKGKR